MDLLSETVKRCILGSLREGAMEICTKEVWAQAVLIGRTERQQTYIECLGPEKLKWPWTFNCLLPLKISGLKSLKCYQLLGVSQYALIGTPQVDGGIRPQD